MKDVFDEALLQNSQIDTKWRVGYNVPTEEETTPPAEIPPAVNSDSRMGRNLGTLIEYEGFSEEQINSMLISAQKMEALLFHADRMTPVTEAYREFATLLISVADRRISLQHAPFERILNSYISQFDMYKNHWEKYIKTSLKESNPIKAQFLLPSRFSSTIMCYPLGIWIALYEEKILNCFLKKRWISMAVLAIILVATYKLRYIDAVMNFASICFALAIIWFLCWFKINSRILEFIGTHVFSIFILQRIPFLMLQTLTPKICEVPMAFVVVSFAVTLVISVAFDKMLKHVDNKIVPLLLEKETPAF